MREPSQKSLTEKLRKQEERLRLREERMAYVRGLPHLHGWKWYKWAREFFESTNRQNFLCAANQISKSSTQIRKCIHWATAKDLWPELWNHQPTQFWYLYPSQEVVNIEFELKWKQFLPKDEYKTHPVYGWKEIKDRGDIKGIRFNSGVFVFFRTYTKDTQHLQTGTVDAIFCDEELPEEHYDELIMRLSATDGYFHMVFTATLGQELWRLTMEPQKGEEEKFPQGAKWTVSLYECKTYEDGTLSHWTEEKIALVRARCKSHAAVLRRVYGRFVVEKGRKYPTFDASKHVKPRHPLPSNWLIFGGVDPGSGGAKGHPAAICFVAVRPDFRAGRVFLGWRGDGITTTTGDVVEKFMAMKAENSLAPIAQSYDWASKDFLEIASRMGESFAPANKSHEKGEEVLNTLFKFDMLAIYEDAELSKLASELSTLRSETPKNHAKDDFIDALRYALMAIPWDFSALTIPESQREEIPEKELTPEEREIKERKSRFEQEENQEAQDEFDEWNHAYGTG